MILLALSALALESPMSNSEDNTIVVIRIFEDIIPETRTNRSAALSPIECHYHVMTGILELSFRSNLGAASSNAGMMTMPVESNSCYTMSIVTESGRSFRASFLTGDSVDDE